MPLSNPVDVATGKAGERVALTTMFAVGAVAIATIGYRTTPFDALIESVASAWKLNPNLLRAIARRESNFRPEAVNTKNDPGEGDDVGLFGINVHTAAHYGVTDRATLEKPEVNAHLAARLLTDLKAELGAKLSLLTLIASYNAGSPAILKRGIFNFDYVATVWAHYQLYQLARAFEPSTGVSPV